MEFFSKSKPRLISDDMIKDVQNALNINENTQSKQTKTIPSNIALNNFYENIISPNMIFFIICFVMFIYLYAQYVTTENEKKMRKKKKQKMKKEMEKQKKIEIEKEKQRKMMELNESEAIMNDINSFVRDNESSFITMDTNNGSWDEAFTEPMNSNINNLWYGESHNQDGLNNATSMLFS